MNCQLMKKFTLTIVFFLFTFNIYAQKENKLIKVSYDIEYKRSVDRDNYSKKKAYLIIYPNKKSRYAVRNLIKSDSISRENKSNNFRSASSTGFAFDEFRELIEKDYSSKNAKITCFGAGWFDFNIYQYNQENMLKWELLEDTTTFESYKCNKAKLGYMGRKYIAWYAPEIPISDGPWKFWGLPGLIVQITDESSEFKIKLSSLSETEVDDTKDLFLDRKNIINITHKQYWEVGSELRSNPKRALIEKMGNPVVNGKEVSESDMKKPPTPNVFEKIFEIEP